MSWICYCYCCLPTYSGLADPRKVLFVVGGIQTKEKPIVNSIEQTDEVAMLDLETASLVGSVDDMEGCTPVTTPSLDPASAIPTKHISEPYHYPRKNKRAFPKNRNSWNSGNPAFRYLQKRHERMNCGPVPTIRIDCAWSDEWS